MRIIRPLHAIGWLAASLVCAVVGLKLYVISDVHRSEAVLITCFAPIFFTTFIQEVFRKVSPQTSKEFPGIPIKPSIYTSFFRAMKKAGIKFSKNAQLLLMDAILRDHAEKTVTAELILACFGNLYARGKIRPGNFAAAPPGDEAALQKAVKKLSSDISNTLYATQVYDGTILISVDEGAIGNLNAALGPLGIEFKPHLFGK